MLEHDSIEARQVRAINQADNLAEELACLMKQLNRRTLGF